MTADFFSYGDTHLFVQLGQVLGYRLVGDGVVLQVALDERLIAGHVDEAVAGEVEEDDLLLAGLLAPAGLADGGRDGVARLGGRDDALCAGKEHACLEGLELRDVDAAHQPVLNQLADNHAGAVVAQTAGVDVGWLEVMAQREHGQQGCVACLVAKVVAELSAGELRAAVGLGGNELSVGVPAAQLVAHEGEGDATEVAAAAEASDDHVGILAGHLHLLLGLQADDGLVQAHVVEHGAKHIFTMRCGGGQLYGFRDGGA